MAMSHKNRSTVAGVAGRLLPMLVAAYIVLIPWMWSASPLHVQPADAIFILLAAAFVASNGLRRISITGLDAAVLVYVAGLTLSLTGVSDLARGFSELAKTLSLVLVFLVVGTIASDDHGRWRIASWIACATAVLCGFGVVDATAHAVGALPAGGMGRDMTVPYLGQVMRLSLGFATPEMLGDYLTCVFPFVIGFFLFRGRGSRAGAAAAVGGVIATEALTFSHSWAGFVIAALIVCWTRWTTTIWLRLRWLIAIGACALLVAINLASTVYVHDLSIEHHTVPAPISLPEHVVETDRWPQIRISATYNYLHYFALKREAWQSFRSHPVTGVGLGGFHDITERAYAAGRISEACRECMSHSTLLGHLAETGLVGSAGLVVLWIAAVVAGRGALGRSAVDCDQWIVCAALAGVIGLMVNGVNADIMHFRFLWVSLALVRSGAARPLAPQSARVI
jgi:hypothetical protein